MNGQHIGVVWALAFCNSGECLPKEGPPKLPMRIISAGVRLGVKCGSLVKWIVPPTMIVFAPSSESSIDAGLLSEVLGRACGMEIGTIQGSRVGGGAT